jgi:hypothetical protein
LPAASLEDAGLDTVDSFVRVRGSLNPTEETVYYFKGAVRAQQPDKRAEKIFDFEGFNVARTVLDENSNWRMLTREVAVYRDPQTGKILETWENPFTGKDVKVLPVWNDPVNAVLGPKGSSSPTPVEDLGEEVCYSVDAFLTYPSPLPREQYPQYSQSDIYQGAELFNFYAEKDDLADPQASSVSAEISWTRIGPWLPWMQMGDRPGEMVYHTRGYKVPSGVDGLPRELRQFVQERNPEFLHAPTEYSTPNETSWTYFKKQLESGDYS